MNTYKVTEKIELKDSITKEVDEKAVKKLKKKYVKN